MKKSNNERVAYSSGDHFSVFASDEKQSTPQNESAKVEIRRETKGRKGSGVITLKNVPPEIQKTLLKDIQKKCGVGGSIKKGIIEIQGDHRDNIISQINKYNLPHKWTGG